MRFPLVPKSPTLDDLELLLWVQLFSEFCASWHVWEATTGRPKRMKIDMHCQRENCCTLRVLFNDEYYVDIAGRS